MDLLTALICFAALAFTALSVVLYVVKRSGYLKDPVVVELSQLRREALLIREELIGLSLQLTRQEAARLSREARAARTRLAAQLEGADDDAQARIDVATVIDDERERARLRRMERGE